MSLKPTDPSTESATLSVPLQSHHQSDSEKSSCYTPRRVAFCRDVLVGNIWLTINIGGGPTDDKPEVVASMPSADDQSHVDSLRGIRWSSRPIGSGKTTVEDRAPAMSCSAAK